MAYFKEIYERYQQATQCLKEKILDEFCKVCGYNRKYAIHKLNGSPPEDKLYAVRRHRQGSVIYSSEAIKLLVKVWQAAGYPCSSRLKQIVALWMPWIEKHFHPGQAIKNQILTISPRQIDRRLQKQKRMVKHRIYGRTKPGTLLKHHIPIKTDHWDVKDPGFTEVDTVSHSGDCADGLFAYSVNQTDILTGWVETRAILGKGEKNVSAALEEMANDFPFNILGIDSDNGSEFINYHLARRCQQRGIQFTRGRPYKKDDNAHVEQKNWTHVRKLFGWNRYETQGAVDMMNNLYKNEWHLFMNLFMPSTKLVQKTRIGSKHKRQHDQPATPLDRLIALGKGAPEKIDNYKKIRKQTDPFDLSKSIERKIQAVYNMAADRPRKITTNKSKQKHKPKPRNIEQEALKEVANIFGIKVKYCGKNLTSQG